MSERAGQLETLKLQWLDATFEDWHVAELAQQCSTSLRRLKLELCRRLGADSIRSISQMHALQHLSLSLSPAAEIPVEALVEMITSLGPNLQTLSLERFPDVDDDVLAAIKTHCTNLTKLRLSHNDVCTDAGFAALFDGWSDGGAENKTNRDKNSTAAANDKEMTTFKAISPLRFADFSSTRDTNSEDDNHNSNNNNNNNEATGDMNAEGNNNNNNTYKDPQTIGLGPAGFTAMMKHASQSLTHLNVSSCRHISHAALIEAFCFGQDVGGDQEQKQTRNQNRMHNEDLYASPSVPSRGKHTNDARTSSGGGAMKARTYPALKHVDLSFVPAVDEVVLQGVFRACPALERVVAFGCFNIGLDGLDGLGGAGSGSGSGSGSGLTVPRGVVLIGVPRAQDAIEQFGMGFDGVGAGTAGMDDRDGNSNRNDNDKSVATNAATTTASSMMIDVAA